MALKRNNEIDMDALAAFLQDATDTVKTEEDVDMLAAVKKRYKQTVPFSLRMYVAAYLAKELFGHRGRRYERNSNSTHYAAYDRHDTTGKLDERPSLRSRNTKEQEFSTTRSSAETVAEERIPHPRVEIPEAEAATIFISIGRNRRVYPRDLIGLLINVVHLDRERIGDIRVLASYSFVQLYKDDIEKTIAALNEYDYRGRKLMVSHSHQKTDGTAPVAEHDTEDAAAYAAAEAAQDKAPFSAPNT
ncbi:MAG: DbpA RNA binding domain-containing protein [Treponema sp.]|nr:DbpA RNA binding domain-containing protein [Treponema sp.]